MHERFKTQPMDQDPTWCSWPPIVTWQSCQVVACYCCSTEWRAHMENNCRSYVLHLLLQQLINCRYRATASLNKNLLRAQGQKANNANMQHQPLRKQNAALEKPCRARHIFLRPPRVQTQNTTISSHLLPGDSTSRVSRFTSHSGPLEICLSGGFKRSA